MPVMCMSGFYDQIFKEHQVPEDVREAVREKLREEVRDYCLCDECMEWRNNERSI
jgi:hypothetical protein